MTISLNAEAETNIKGISLTREAVIPSVKYAQHQGTKLHLALGEKSPGVGEIVQSMSSGNSEYYKELLADKDVLERQSRKNEVLSVVLQESAGNVSPVVMDMVQGLTDQELRREDLDTLLEEKYSKIYTEMATAAIENDIVDEAFTENQDHSFEMIDRSERIAYKNNVARTALDNLQNNYAEAGFLQKVWDFGERIIPFYEWYKKHDTLGVDLDGILPGSNLEEQYYYLMNAEPQEFNDRFNQAVEYLTESNPQIAQSWVEGFLSYGSTDSTMDNLFGLLDVASVVPLSKVAKLGQALKGVVKGSVKNPNEIYKIAAELGKNQDATTGIIMKDLKGGTFFGDINNAKALEESLPSIFRVDESLSGATKLPSAMVNRVKMWASQRSDRVKELLLDPPLVDTLSPGEVTKLTDEAVEGFKKDYPSVAFNVIDVRKSDVADLGNAYKYDIVIGRRDGGLFESEAQARNYINRWIRPKFSDVQIEQVGEGFQGIISRNIDESKVFNTKLELDQRTPVNYLDDVLRTIRSPDYTLAKDVVNARGTAVQSSESIAHYLDILSEPIKRLSSDKKAFSELDEIFVQNRADMKFHDKITDFEEAFYTKFNKNPSESQVNAYYAYVQINDLDLVVRDLNWYKQKVALGLENISLKVEGEGAVSFEGKVLDDLPWGSETPFLYQVLDKGQYLKKSKYSKSFTTLKDKQEMDKLIAKGFKVIQLSEPTKIKGRTVNYILTKDFQRGKVGLVNVQRKPGGHREHYHDFYIKQGKIDSRDDGSKFFAGDTTLFNIRNEKEGNEILQALETARKKVVAGDKDAYKWIRDNLPITPKEWILAVKRGDIDINVPFALTKKGIRSLDTGVYGKLDDVTRNEHSLSKQIVGKYGGERDATEIKTIYSEGNGVFKIDDAPYISPIDTLRGATQNMVSTRAMNDYTKLTAQNFYREFGDILDGTKEEILSNLNEWLINPRFITPITRSQESRIKMATNASQQYKYLAGYGTKIDNAVNSFKDRMASSVLEKLTPTQEKWAQEKIISRIKDPTVFMRAAVFQMKMGMYNVRHLALQASSLVNIVAIGGRNGVRGGLAYPWVRASMMSNEPAVWKGIAKKVEQSGLMKADEFEEAMNTYRKSGFHTVGKDVAYLDDLKGPDLKTTKVGSVTKKVLDLGTTPFKEGERIARISAWMTAYLDQKALVGGRALTRRDVTQILQRAKDLTGNMTRDSNAVWQRGYGSTLTQFFGYQARITEQMLGKKLTGIEKAKLFTAYSMLFGVPTGAGSVVGVLPIREIVRDEMLSAGVNPDDSMMEPFIDGFASAGLEYIFGSDMNVSAMYGPGGLPTLYDIIQGDKEIGEIALGASGSILTQTLMDAYPALKAMRSEMFDFDGGYYNTTPDDFIRPLRNITSVDNTVKLWNLYNTGIWASKNGTSLTEMSLPEGLATALLGIQPQEMEASFAKLKVTKDFQDHIKSVQKDGVRKVRDILKMEGSTEKDVLIRELKAYFKIEGLSDKEVADIYRRARDLEPLTEKSEKDYIETIKRKEGNMK